MCCRQWGLPHKQEGEGWGWGGSALAQSVGLGLSGWLRLGCCCCRCCCGSVLLGVPAGLGLLLAGLGVPSRPLLLGLIHLLMMAYSMLTVAVTCSRKRGQAQAGRGGGQVSAAAASVQLVGM